VDAESAACVAAGMRRFVRSSGSRGFMVRAAGRSSCACLRWWFCSGFDGGVVDHDLIRGEDVNHAVLGDLDVGDD
jgi:hypothetical protein